ncbi:penicillin-binding protein [Virgibacillus sp. AGTR]|uniref:transglycosylase domain-containing protein n=1 Tax=Virgibacillus sp. AGTR TaxID=2812055 RepID=UPI001963A946|nr:transglycosylase domain-containing protein [Virgibacillus sp. AGTR]MCC2250547.1 penicillin-binding protein [Virgibacillus sp. AGTR]QRZ17724.1 penicillin-binding protein [Virgibacillus sp. AGTR]
MNFKERLHTYFEKAKSIWKTGKIQTTSRISYSVVWNVILFFLVIGLIGMFFAGGVGAGYFASLVKDEPVRSYEVMKQDIYNYEETSKLYFAGDKYFGDVRSDLYREETTLENISPTLLDAVIATEDEYFKEHKGVVPKAILRAVLQEALNSNVKTGGSTLTQQLIKNQILTNEVSFERKAKEILLALRLERFFEKDEILEAYLNIVPYGRDASGNNIAGVQTAAQGVFGVDAKDVNLAQAAYLAGLPQSPSAYTPFTSDGNLKEGKSLERGINRMKSVLNRMYESEYITKKAYEEAMAYDITKDFTGKSKSPIEKYPYLTFEVEKRAKEILTTQLAKQDGYTEEDLAKDDDLEKEYQSIASRNLRVNGYHIHTTINKEIYEEWQDIVKNYQYYGPDRTFTKTVDGETVEVTEKVQTGGMLIENSSGKIISFVGGREFGQDSQYNYATLATRSPGSTIKPILDYAPAMEEGKIQPGSVLADIRKPLPGWPAGKPGNYGGGFHGIVSARTALAQSYNIPAAEVYSKILHLNPAKKYLEKMGITTLKEIDYRGPAASIGTMDVSVEENVNAFATLGNNGKFADAYMIEKITTNDGEVVYEHKSKPVDVFTPQTNYLTIDMMRDVISSGTARFLNGQLNYGGVDWAGKTGTSQDYKDAWFVATNPNVTFGTWIGYKTPHSIYNSSMSLSYSQRNMKLWAQLMNKATAIDPELLAPTNSFKRPGGIVQRSYCAISGMLPSELCEKAGLVRSDLFNAKFVPTKKDDSLITGSIVMVDGKAVVAGPNTPSEFTKGDGLAFNPEFLKRNGYDKLADISQLFPNIATEKWEKISAPNKDAGDMLKDDGKAPSAPTSLKKSGKKLTWKKSGSKDVVGYRIYRATGPGNKFTLVGSTTSTNFNIGTGDARYHVKAVDYFGLESGASKELLVGDTGEKEPETPDKGKEKDTVKDKDKNKEEDEKPVDDKDTDKKDPDSNKKDNDEDTVPRDEDKEETPTDNSIPEATMN